MEVGCLFPVLVNLYYYVNLSDLQRWVGKKGFHCEDCIILGIPTVLVSRRDKASKTNQKRTYAATM